MMRKLILLLLAVCLLPCAATGEEWFCSFIDDAGVSVSLSAQPRRVAVLLSSYAEVWQLAVGTVAVTVGESIERGFAPEGTPLVDAGAGKTIDLELLLAAQPDFVIASADIPAQVDACHLLRSAIARSRVENR